MARILVVEDEADIALGLQLDLGDEGQGEVQEDSPSLVSPVVDPGAGEGNLEEGEEIGLFDLVSHKGIVIGGKDPLPKGEEDGFVETARVVGYLVLSGDVRLVALLESNSYPLRS